MSGLKEVWQCSCVLAALVRVSHLHAARRRQYLAPEGHREPRIWVQTQPALPRCSYFLTPRRDLSPAFQRYKSKYFDSAYLKHREKQEVPIPSLRFQIQSLVANQSGVGTRYQGQFHLACLPLSGAPMLGVRITAPCPQGKGVLLSDWDFWWCPKLLKRSVSLDAWSVLQFPCPKYTLCFWKLWMENGVKWNNNTCCDDLVLTSGYCCPHSYSQKTAGGLCHIQEGLTWSLPCRHLWFGVERSSPPCLGHTSLALCLTDQCFTVASTALGPDWRRGVHFVYKG